MSYSVLTQRYEANNGDENSLAEHDAIFVGPVDCQKSEDLREVGNSWKLAQNARNNIWDPIANIYRFNYVFDGLFAKLSLLFRPFVSASFCGTVARGAYRCTVHAKYYDSCN